MVQVDDEEIGFTGRFEVHEGLNETRGFAGLPAMRALEERVGDYYRCAAEAVAGFDGDDREPHPAALLGASYAMVQTARGIADRVSAPYALYTPQHAGELLADALRTIQAACEVIAAASGAVGAMAKVGAIDQRLDGEVAEIVRLGGEWAGMCEGQVAADGAGLAERVAALTYRGYTPCDMPGLLSAAGVHLCAAGASAMKVIDQDPEAMLQIAFDYRGEHCTLALDPLCAWFVATDEHETDLPLATDAQVHPARLAEQAAKALDLLIDAELNVDPTPACA